MGDASSRESRSALGRVSGRPPSSALRGARRRRSPRLILDERGRVR